MRPVLITGAAGNLGSLLARHMQSAGYPLRLMFHKRPLAPEIAQAANVTAVQADLADTQSLRRAVTGADVVVHFAGRLDRQPISVHAQTRLEEERLLFAKTEGSATVPVVLRLGMVYGRGILMIDAARWLARRHLLGVWREPTWVHLLSKVDFLHATEASIVRQGVHGTYHLGDEQPVTLQQFLDAACRVWGVAPPMRLPVWSIVTAARLCEIFATMTGSASPLTRDFIQIGRVSYWGDTRRAREELIPSLVYPTLESGVHTLAVES